MNASGVDLRFDDADVPLLVDAATVRLLGTEAVVWAHHHVSPSYLDPLATLVMQLIDGDATIGELVGDVQDVVGVPNSLARTQIHAALARLDGAGMLRSAGDQPEPVDPHAPLDLFPAPPST